jgi:lipoyl-dependent peroxiredoxin
MEPSAAKQATETSSIHIDRVLYTAKAHTTGGREGGSSRTDDGHLNVHFSSPADAAGTGTNPEQLFAAGWSTCFLSAMKLIASKRKIELPKDTAIDAEVDLGLAHSDFTLAGRLNISLPGLDRETAKSLVEAAEQTCPYSRAIRGNVEATVNLV